VQYRYGLIVDSIISLPKNKIYLLDDITIRHNIDNCQKKTTFLFLHPYHRTASGNDKMFVLLCARKMFVCTWSILELFFLKKQFFHIIDGQFSNVFQKKNVCSYLIIPK
jgi:hypothetical protein